MNFENLTIKQLRKLTEEYERLDLENTLKEPESKQLNAEDILNSLE